MNPRASQWRGTCQPIWKYEVSAGSSFVGLRNSVCELSYFGSKTMNSPQPALSHLRLQIVHGPGNVFDGAKQTYFLHNTSTPCCLQAAQCVASSAVGQ